MTDSTDPSFDFAGFKKSFVEQEIKNWAAFFADDAEWIEYKHTHPPRSPRRMTGRTQIEGFLADIKASNITLKIEDEVIGPTRAAFCVWCILPDGKRIVENVIIHFEGGKITRQVDVEAWD